MEMQFFKKLFAQNKSKRKSVSRFSRTVRFEPLENRELLTASPSDAPINVETYSQQYLEDGVFTCNGTLTFSFGGSETANQDDEMTFSAGGVSITATQTGLCVTGQSDPSGTIVVNVQAGDSFSAPSRNIQVTGGTFGTYGLEDWADSDYNDLVVHVSFLPDYVSDPDPESDPKCDCTCGADGVTQNAAGWKDPSNNISRPADFYNTLNLKAESALPQNALNEFPVSVKATYTLNNSITQDVYYTVGSFDPTEKFTTAAQLDTSSLSSGRYDWTIELLYTYADNTTSNETFTGQTSIVNLSDSPYGAGVNLTGLSHLNFSDWDNQVGSGINWERSCGKKVWFTWDGTDFIAEDGESVNSTLTPNLNGYTIIDHNERFTFNSAGQLTLREGLTDGALTMWAYNADGTAYSKTDESGRVTTYSYSNGLLSSVTDFAGRTTTYTYDQYNRLTSITQPAADNQSLPQTTSFTYDGTSNRILTQTDPDGTVTAYAYQNGVLTSITRNGITEMQQSAFVSQALPDLSVEGYDAAHPAQLVSQQDGQGEYVNKYGVTTSYVLDANNNVVYQNTNGIEIFSTYDSNGLLLQRTENNSNTLHVDYRQTLYEYDARGNLTLVTYPDGSTERWTYDGTFDQVTSYTDPLGNRTIYTVDSVTGLTTSARQVVGEVDDLQNGETDDVVTLYAYNADKRLVSVTDALGFVTAYTYDARGNVLTETTAYGTALAAATLYTYDSADRLTSSTDPLGRTTNYQYDALDRLVQTTLPAAQTGADRLTTQSVYNNLGQLVQSTDVNGAVTVYTYNAAGQLASVATGASTSTYAYNAYGDLLTVTDSLGSVTRYEYNANGKLIATYTEDGLGSSVQTSAVTYDAWGRTATETNAAGVTLSYEYDKMDRVVKITCLNDNVVLETRTYDAAGNLKTVTDALNHTTTYTYDALGNLTQIVNPDGSATQYAYDKLGRIVSTTDALGNTTAYTYDANGNQTSATDAEGNTTSYTYDAAGQLVSSADPSGSVATYAYDGLGRNTSVTLSNINNTESVTTSTVYSIQTVDSVRYNVVTQYDALGNSVVSTYDVYGDLLSVQQGTAITTYAYNSEGQLVSQTDALNHTTQYAYDYLGNLASVTAADNTVTTYNYNAAGQLISQTDALGTITQYSYDYLGNVVSTVVINNTGSLAPSSDNLYPISSWLDESQTFNGTSDKVVIGNPAELNFTGEITLSATVKIDSFNGFQDILAHGYTFSPAGEVFLRLNGNLIQVGSYNGPTYGATALLDASDLGQWITFTGTYDGENWNLYKDGVLIVSTPSAVGAVTVNADWVIGASAQNDRFFKGEIKDVAIWDSALSAEEIQLYRQYGPCQYAALNKSTYNALGWLTTSTDANGNATSYTYDSMGRVLTVTDALGNTTSYVYDLLGRVFEQTTPQGAVTRYTYDAVGNVTKTEQYDLSDTSITPTVITTLYTYTPTGAVASITDPEGNTTSYGYDYRGLAISETNAKGYTRYFEYDANGRLTEKTDRNGRVTTYTYDAAGRLTSESWLDSSNNAVNTFTYQYDILGNLLSAFDGVSSCDYTYDTMNRIDSMTIMFDAQMAVFSYTYDTLGRQTESSLRLNGVQDRTINIEYDYLGRALSAELTGNALNDILAEFDYNSVGALTDVRRFEWDDTDELYNLIAQSQYQYNARNQITNITHADASNVAIAAHSYSFSPDGNITQYTNSIDGTVTYTNDFLGQLTGADYSNLLIHDESYQYDLNGNRELVTNANGDLVVYSTGLNNELNSDGNYSYTYDAEGNRISKTNAAGTERELYEWDYRNRLSSVTKQEYNATTQEWETVQIVEYAYDYNNVLIRKVLDANGDGTADSKTLFLPENYQTAIQLDDADLSDSTYETVSHRYLWTPQNQDKLLADVTPTETLWTLTDHLGTIRDIIQNTPSGLVVPAHVIYDAYGNVLSCKDANGTNVSNPVLFGFTGKYFDADTQLQNNVNRWYDATTGRWLSTDPIGFNGNDTNLYRYVGNRIGISFDIYGLSEYQEGDFTPTIINDLGSGEHGCLADSMTENEQKLYDNMQWVVFFANVWGYHDAAKHLRHYLNNTGNDLEIDLARFIREVPSAQPIIDEEISMAKNFAETIKDKNSFKISSSRTTEGYATKDTPNWFYAVGGYSLYGKGEVSLCNDEYTMIFTIYFDDRYNWDAGKGVKIFGYPISDVSLGRLHQVGLGQEFNIKGEVQYIIKWKKGTESYAIKDKTPSQKRDLRDNRR